MAEHRRAIKHKDLNYATANHAVSTGHVVNVDNPIILGCEKRWNRRLWLEAAHIQRSKVMNSNIGKRTISDAWNPYLCI
ncbi:MAG TPA: hypothetical protein VKR58_13260 [Aquella sp.]|nr:hypothetical protein [Aquella sp.]